MTMTLRRMIDWRWFVNECVIFFRATRIAYFLHNIDAQEGEWSHDCNSNWNDNCQVCCWLSKGVGKEKNCNSGVLNAGFNWYGQAVFVGLAEQLCDKPRNQVARPGKAETSDENLKGKVVLCFSS